MLYITIGIIIFVLLVILFSSRARIKSNYEKQMKIGNEQGITGAQVAVFAKKKYHLDIKFNRTKQDLSDAYFPKQRILLMSDRVCDTPSIASVAIVSHELGHALQHKEKSKLFRTNEVLSAITRVTNRFIIPLIIIGLILYTIQVPNETLGLILVIIAGALFLLHALLKLITIPLEFDASHRAVKIMTECKLLSKKEIAKTKKLLNTAGQTYILALFDGIFISLRKLKELFLK